MSLWGVRCRFIIPIARVCCSRLEITDGWQNYGFTFLPDVVHGTFGILVNELGRFTTIAIDEVSVKRL